MRKKPLTETNPYLKDPTQRQSLLWTAVSSSSTIEGARVGAPERLSLLKPSIQPTALGNPQRPPDHVAENPFHRPVISVQASPERYAVLLCRHRTKGGFFGDGISKSAICRYVVGSADTLEGCVTDGTITIEYEYNFTNPAPAGSRIISTWVPPKRESCPA